MEGKLNCNASWSRTGETRKLNIVNIEKILA